MSSPSRVRGGAPAAITFYACFRQQKASGRILLPLVRVLENQIQALSRTFRHRFKDFQGPCLFSRTFQALKIWKNYSRTFKDFQGSAGALKGLGLIFGLCTYIKCLKQTIFTAVSHRIAQNCPSGWGCVPSDIAVADTSGYDNPQDFTHFDAFCDLP